MDTADAPLIAATRRMWQAIEPIHMSVYFAPEPADDARRIGLRGYWMGYFTGRLAPLGAVPAQAATALLYVFAPAMVERAIPDAWQYAKPHDIVTSRITSAASALRRQFPQPDLARFELLAGLLWEAVSGCPFDGRPLAAAWSQTPRPDDAVAAAWLAATIVREHRGEGHVLAAVAAGLRRIEAALTHAATGAITLDTLQRSRGWDHAQLKASTSSLTARGLLDDNGQLTSKGQALRHGIEHKTDQLASAPARHLGEERVRRVTEVAAPLSRQLIDSGLVPVPNPAGASRP